MKINVLMPVFATPVEWVREAVDSIIAQNHPDFNLVIVDDNNPKGELTEFLYGLSKQDCCISVVRKPCNEGIAAALNFGLKHCHGDLVVRMDADDIAHQDLLKKHDEFFTRYPDRHICGVQIKLFMQDDPVRQWESSHPPVVTRSLAGSIPGHWFVNHPGIAFRNGTMKIVGGYNSTPPSMAEDYALWVKFLLYGYTIYNLPEVLMTYRVHSKSFSFAPDRKAPVWHEFLSLQKQLLHES